MRIQEQVKSLGRWQIALALSIALLVAQVSWPRLNDWLNRPYPGRQVTQHDAAYPYLVYLPASWPREQAETTLLIYLHGRGAQGADLDPRRLGGPARLIDAGKSLPMIVVSPQCPVTRFWETRRLRELLGRLQTRFRPRRVVVTGYSMGGGGTWEFIQAYPELVAAAAPVCGCGNPAQADKLTDIPVWAFHGELDDLIPVKCSRDMVEAINASGGTANLTIFPDQRHGISRIVYENPRLYEWLLKPRRMKLTRSNGDDVP